MALNGNNEHVGRMYLEHSDLAKKIDKLKAFILSDNFDKIHEVDQQLLKEQLQHMEAYFRVLNIRVSRTCNNA